MDVQVDQLTYSYDKGKNSIFSFNVNNSLSRSGSYALSTAATREVLLQKVDIHLHPGTVSSVFGDDSEAVHDLVQILALRQTRGYLEGSIYYDTVNRGSGLYRDIAYVPEQQDYFHFERLRVFESLYYAARLRTLCSELECRERARETARFLEIDGSSFVGKL